MSTHRLRGGGEGGEEERGGGEERGKGREREISRGCGGVCYQLLCERGPYGREMELPIKVCIDQH